MIQQIRDTSLEDGIESVSSLYHQHLAKEEMVRRRRKQSRLKSRTASLQSLLKNNSKRPLKPLNEYIDLEDITTPSTRERWGYMRKIQSGAIKIVGRIDFKSAGSIRINKDGRWFVTGASNSNAFYGIDSMSFEKLDTIEVVAYKNFNPGDYLIRTADQRVFQGDGISLQFELDPVTLIEKVDKFFYPSIFVGFRKVKYSGNGYERRSLGRILLRQAEDVYAAMIDIANGDANSSDYMTTNATMKWITTLSSIQRKRELHGGHYALHKALDYMFKDMSVPASFEGCTKKAYSIYRNPVSEVIPLQVKYKGRYSPPRYYGDRVLIVDNFVGKLLLPIPMLNAISTFSNNRSG